MFAVVNHLEVAAEIEHSFEIVGDWYMTVKGTFTYFDGSSIEVDQRVLVVVRPERYTANTGTEVVPTPTWDQIADNEVFSPSGNPVTFNRYVP